MVEKERTNQKQSIQGGLGPIAWVCFIRCISFSISLNLCNFYNIQHRLLTILHRTIPKHNMSYSKICLQNLAQKINTEMIQVWLWTFNTITAPDSIKLKCIMHFPARRDKSTHRAKVCCPWCWRGRLIYLDNCNACFIWNICKIQSLDVIHQNNRIILYHLNCHSEYIKLRLLYDYKSELPASCILRYMLLDV